MTRKTDVPFRTPLAGPFTQSTGQSIQHPPVFWPGGHGWFLAVGDHTGNAFLQLRLSQADLGIYGENFSVPGFHESDPPVVPGNTGKVLEFSAPQGFLTLVSAAPEEGDYLNVTSVAVFNV